MISCKECGKEPIYIKKRGLGIKCYNRLWRNGKLSDVKHLKKRERIFVENFFTHNNWLHEPVSFKFGDTFYVPDFYDGARNVFIEVVGSRQAYHLNKSKYQSMYSRFPKIKFEIRTPDGAEIQIDDNLRIIWPEEVNGK